ncbi:MAG: lipopolysaccharide heptosyltransferase I [Pseudomonadales bacterium]
MKVLLVKTSSLGDVIHALPAVTEALSKFRDLQIDWLVEEKFRDIPDQHEGVHEVIPVAIRRWRSDWVSAWPEVKALIKRLRSAQYDRVIDSQGLLKSALITFFANGETHGYDRDSIRESIACLFYGKKHAVDKEQHAIHRQKQLLAASLGYRPNQNIDCGLATPTSKKKTIMLLHGTTWPSKEWPESAWTELANLIRQDGFEVMAPSGNERERERATRILGGRPGLLDRLPLGDLMSEMQRCAGAVAVDTGLGHLAPALGVPVVGLYGSTSPGLTGILGRQSQIIASDHLPCIPCRKRECQFQKPRDSSNIYPLCFEQTSPELVWQALQQRLRSKETKLD